MQEPTPDVQPTSQRRRGRLPRLRRASRRVRNKLSSYRRLTIGTGLLALVLAVVLAVALTNKAAPEPVTLGTGKAGLKISDSAAVAMPVRPPETVPAPTGAEANTKPPGIAAGSGEASYYSEELAGNPTASGEPFDPAKLTAAHRTLPLGSRLRVTNTRNGKSVVVRVNDRGPFSGRRIIDLSYAAARQIGMVRSGTARVRIELLR